jgi:hypothetical protein
MLPQTNINEIAHVIQLAIAPVFLLTAIGTIISVLTNRLSRIIDRIRVLEERLSQFDTEHLQLAHEELNLLGRRMRLIYVSVASAVFSALFVGLLIVVAFADAFMAANLSKFVGLMFVLAMFAFILCLVVFLREIFLAVTSTRKTMK